MYLTGGSIFQVEVLHMSVISIHELKKYYGKSRGVESVTFDVEEGEIFGFIGPNGAGKSTTIKLLLSLLKPDQGSASIFDLDIIKDSAKIKEDLGYVPGEVRYYPDMRVSQLMETTLRFHHKNPSDYRSLQKELCDIFDLDSTKKFEDLSLGNKKKAAIAQALIHNPKLIILDEPTNGLDPLIQKYLFEYLKKLNRAGATILFSSHNLTEVQTNCRRAAFIKEGRIIEMEDLTANSKKEKVVTVTLEDSSRTLETLPGEASHLLHTGGNEYTFLYKGESEQLLTYLNTLSPKDFIVENASLESRFLSYYEGGHA